MGKTFQVFLLGLKDKIHTVDVASSEAEFKNTTVAKFKEMVVKLTNTGAEDIRLIFGDKQLEEMKTFGHYEIIPKSNILMVLKLPGGNC